MIAIQSVSQEDSFDLPRFGTRRYYFDIQDGDQILRDNEGLELDGIEAVRREAMRALPEMAKDTLPDQDQRTLVVHVRDEFGQTVLMAALSMMVQQIA